MYVLLSEIGLEMRKITTKYILSTTNIPDLNLSFTVTNWLRNAQNHKQVLSTTNIPLVSACIISHRFYLFQLKLFYFVCIFTNECSSRFLFCFFVLTPRIFLPVSFSLLKYMFISLKYSKDIKSRFQIMSLFLVIHKILFKNNKDFHE